MPESNELDPLVHGQIRLASLSLLIGAEEADFGYLKDHVGATDGNLSIHLSKLETAGYIRVKKHFVDKKPQSLYRITEKGRAAFLNYVETLKSLLGKEFKGKK
jgi:DNA-binding MarR family transcriptional regulator